MAIKFRKIFGVLIVLALGAVFVVKFAGPALLTQYVKTGVGDCQKIPILCMEPKEDLPVYSVNKEYAGGLINYKFTKMAISIPNGFSIVQETIKKYYKKKPQNIYAIFYVLHEEPGYFLTLYPQLKTAGVKDDYEFMKRLTSARVDRVNNLADAFFVIMKGIFTPNLGEQTSVRMARFTIGQKKGFINYNLTGPTHYYDCNLFNERGGFFKVYIKDKDNKLDMEKVLTIVAGIQDLT